MTPADRRLLQAAREIYPAVSESKLREVLETANGAVAQAEAMEVKARKIDPAMPRFAPFRWAWATTQHPGFNPDVPMALGYDRHGQQVFTIGRVGPPSASQQAANRSVREFTRLTEGQ